MWFFGKSSQAQFPLEGKRRPQYAGSWYDSDPVKLKEQLQEFLRKADPPVDAKAAAALTNSNAALTRPVLAIVVPHAGYVFSGRAAAHAYRAVAGQEVKRVFLLGPSHHVGFHGCALPMAVTFGTPLGDLDVDKEALEDLRNYPLFSKMPEVHRVEHSLEMQLPFIKEAFGDVKIVPIVIGTLSDETEAQLIAAVLKGYVRHGDLVVVSSDFTHFGPRYDYQPFTDNIRENIRKLDGRALSYLSKLDLYGFMRFQKETGDTICGFFPCAVLSALLPASSRATLLQYYTSQDTPVEDKSNSVSYLAIAFSGGDWPEHPHSKTTVSDTIRLSDAEKRDLLKLSRATLESYVRHLHTPTADELKVSVTPAMRRPLGVFVTLNKVRGKLDPTDPAYHAGKQLRGCIGYIWPLKPLYQAVIDNTVSACSRDHRFRSVEAHELEDLAIEISVLTPPRRVRSYEDITLGRDGIVMMKDGHQSVFLPFVPTEFGWNLSQTLTQLSRKAGLSSDDWLQGAKFDVFQAEVVHE